MLNVINYTEHTYRLWEMTVRSTSTKTAQPINLVKVMKSVLLEFQFNS